MQSGLLLERVFRGLNTDLLIRPIRHRLAERVRAHVLIRLLAYYVTWHMQQKLATLLADLATITASRIQPADGLPAFTVITTPTPSSAAPSSSSAFPTASGTRSQAASDHRLFPQASAPLGPKWGKFGLKDLHP